MWHLSSNISGGPALAQGENTELLVTVSRSPRLTFLSVMMSMGWQARGLCSVTILRLPVPRTLENNMYILEHKSRRPGDELRPPPPGVPPNGAPLHTPHPHFVSKATHVLLKFSLWADPFDLMETLAHITVYPFNHLLVGSCRNLYFLCIWIMLRAGNIPQGPQITRMRASLRGVFCE